MLVVGDKLSFYFKVVHKLARHAHILSADKVNIFKRLHCSIGNITEVAYRRSYYI